MKRPLERQKTHQFSFSRDSLLKQPVSYIFLFFFDFRELAMNAKLVVKMNGKRTRIYNTKVKSPDLFKKKRKKNSVHRVL